MRLRHLLGALCTAASFCAASLSSAAIPASEQATAVEFYHAGLDHYFISADPAEISDLDTGKHAGWIRTGYRFAVIKAGSTLPDTVPMCRFYSPSVSTHFYSAKAAECEDVKTKFPDTWQFESSEVFRAFLVNPETGACPADTTPTYRLYNKRADPNHRYTDQLSAFVYMLGKGYQPEGDGDPAVPVVFCTPSGGDAVPAAAAEAPTCTVGATSKTPALGSTLALTSTCTNTPTSYLWVNCASTQASCNASKSTAGAMTYTLYAANAQGPSEPAPISVTWGGGGGGGGAVPICQVTAPTVTPATGTSLTLTANCSQTPATYEWVECNYLVQSICNAIPSCSNSTSTCSVFSSIAGFARYMVAGINAAGTGPRAPIEVEWTGGTNPTNPNPNNPDPNPNEPAPVCSAYTSDFNPVVGSTVRLTASCSGSPTSIVWGGVSCGSSIYCNASSSTAGTVTYSVYAVNASGTSGTAYVSVNWTDTPTNQAPVCSVSSSSSSPSVGTSITLTATCSNAPQTYSWTGCSSTGPTCTDSAASVGAKAYTVVATNANGNSQPASISVNWGAVPTQPPVCQISASNTSPTVGQTVTLSATCSGGATNYQWTGCTPTSNTSSTCSVTSSGAGQATYYVAGGNQYGFSNAAGVVVTWQSGGGNPNPPTSCSQYSNVIYLNLAWGDTERTRTSRLSEGGFGPDTVIVMAMTVPASPTSYASPGSTTMVEFQGPPTLRHVTLSNSPCDFRDPDPSGVNGPIDAAGGVQATIRWNVGGDPLNLVAGRTYYFNFRNLNCAQSRCDAGIDNFWPR